MSKTKMSDTARRIKELRFKLGLTQEQFAQKVGVSFSTVSRWENGRGHPSRLAWLQIERLQTTGGFTSGECESQLEKQE